MYGKAMDDKTACFSNDMLDFIELLYKYNIKYVIVGGEAVIYYGYPRLTGDVDFFYETSLENATNLYNLLNEFWEGDIPGIGNKDDLLEKGVVVQFGVPPNRIDLINEIEDVTFDEAWLNRTTEILTINKNQIKVCYIGLEQLIKNKKAAGRNKDMDDLRYLEHRKF